MHTQTTGAGDKAHPDLPHGNGGTGEKGSQREENDFDRGAMRTATPTLPLAAPAEAEDDPQKLSGEELRQKLNKARREPAEG